MKNKFKKKAITPITALKEEIKELWVLDTSQEYMKKLSTSLLRRLQPVIN
jgi:hypothetical protein